jgi:hypothetical protein
MAAERLLMDSYPSSNKTVSSLDDLRASIALVAFKQNRVSAIASSLPPTSNAFYHHCARVARQVQIWCQALTSDMTIEVIEHCDGFDADQQPLQLKWISNTVLPMDPRLSVCGKCTGNCQRCCCAKNRLICTMVCKCSQERCENRERKHPSEVREAFNITFALFFIVANIHRSFTRIQTLRWWTDH